MNLANLLLELKSLLGNPEKNFSRIVDLLEKHQKLAEYEVARFFVMKSIQPGMAKRLGSLDPKERLRGIQTIQLTYARASSARELRRLVKDSDPHVRARARAAVRALQLTDVALPDSRFETPPVARPHAIGGWNPSGWGFGLWPHLRRKRKRTAIPGLPTSLKSAELAKLLGFGGVPNLSPGGYVEFEVPKASGGTRTLAAPREALKKVQRKILTEILDKIPAHEAAHGFVINRSVVTNARPHMKAAVVVKMDLKDFFPTIHYRRVEGLFRDYGFDAFAAHTLAGLTTYRSKLPDGRLAWPGALPQGAPTSPAIANLVCRRMDSRLSKLAAKAGAVYTRYADDLTFSFRLKPERDLGRFLWWVDQICQQEGFAENYPKRRILRPGNQQRVTGIVVNAGVNIPRADRRRFKAILANCRSHGVTSQAKAWREKNKNERDDFGEYLKGFAAWVAMVQPELGRKWQAEVKALLASDT